MQLLSDGRFTLGLGAGKNLNELIVGGHWPVVGLAPRDARGGRRDHSRHSDISRQALLRRVREGLGPAKLASADRRRGIRAQKLSYSGKTSNGFVRFPCAPYLPPKANIGVPSVGICRGIRVSHTHTHKHSDSPK